jgi:hypothetical protein
MYLEFERMKTELPKLILVLDNFSKMVQYTQQGHQSPLSEAQSIATAVDGGKIQEAYVNREKIPLLEGTVRILKTKRDAIRQSPAIGSKEIRDKNLALENLESQIEKLDEQITILMSPSGTATTSVG